MAIVSSKELLEAAFAGGYAVPAINVDSIDTIIGTLEVFEEKKAPVLLQLAPVQVHNRNCSYKAYCEIITAIANEHNVACSIHLDHGDDVDDVILAANSGFNSVMFDGSKLSFEQNIEMTKKVRASIGNVLLEGEVGVLKGQEGSVEVAADEDEEITTVEQATTYVEQTGVDILAIAIGNAHGVYKSEPKLRFDRLTEINKALGIPLVLHGASGLSETDISQAVKNGISKINFFTDVDNAYTAGMLQRLNELPNAYSFDYMVWAKANMKNALENIIDMCGCGGKL